MDQTESLYTSIGGYDAIDKAHILKRSAPLYPLGSNKENTKFLARHRAF